jgi:hypothetical protein
MHLRAPQAARRVVGFVTIRNVGDWPIEWRDSNWTFRDASDSHC